MGVHLSTALLSAVCGSFFSFVRFSACSKKYKDQNERDEEGTVMNVGTDELQESKKEIKWNIKRFPLCKDGMRPICAKKKRDLLKHCEGLPEDRRAYCQDMKADGDVVDSGKMGVWIECGGSSICQHRRRRNQCKECARSICLPIPVAAGSYSAESWAWKTP